MKLFNFFSSKNESTPTMAISLPVSEQSAPVAEPVVESNVTATAETEQNTTLTVSNLTGWPIDMIYGYLQKNYETKGFEDAMVKSDLAFRDMNMKIIRNKILMVFREINLDYDVRKHDLENRIEQCRAAGLLSIVAEIEKHMTIISTHKEELRQLEEDFRNNANEASVPLQSYDCGFLRGIATLALSATTKATAPVPNMTTPNGIKLTA